MTRARDDHEARLRDWLAAYIDGEIDPAEHEAMMDAVASDPDLARKYVELMEVHSILQWDTTSKPVKSKAPTGPVARAHRLTGTPVVYAAAAAIAIATALTLYVFISKTEPDAPEPVRTPIATLIDVDGATVIYDQEIANAGDSYARGMYSIDSGSAELMLTNGTRLQMHGASRVRIDNPLDATITEGQVTVRCPRGAEGFIVRLPNGHRVIDLGTEFDVRITDSGATEVRVFEGMVEVDYRESGLGLLAGQAVAIEADGSIHAIDEVIAIARNAHDPIDTPTVVNEPSIFPFKGDRYDPAHLFDNQTTGEGSDYAGYGPGPHELVLDLGAPTNIRGLRFVHRQDSGDWLVDRIARIEVAFGDSSEFDPSTLADLSIIPDLNRRDPQDFAFAVRTARYVRVRLVGLPDTVNPGAAMLHLLGEPAAENYTETSP